MFSNYIIFLLEKIYFIKVISARFIRFLIKKDNRIALLRLDYNTARLFDNSFIIFNYNFKNAIYYKFNGRRTLEHQIKVFNLQNINYEIEFIVYGFFQKKIYKIKFEPVLTLNADSFKTNLYSLKLNLEEKLIPKLIHQDVFCKLNKPIIRSSKIKITNKHLKFKKTFFNLNDNI